MDIVPLCSRVKPDRCSLASIRKCVAALLQEWDVTKTDELLAELVIFRVHGMQIQLPQPVGPYNPTIVASDVRMEHTNS